MHYDDRVGDNVQNSHIVLPCTLVVLNAYLLSHGVSTLCNTR